MKSTGPKTPEGKAAVRFNALKSGVDAESILLPCEDPAALALFAQRFDDEWCPAGDTERAFVTQMTHDCWRIERLRLTQTHIWATLDFENGRLLLGRVQRHIARAERSYSRALTAIQRLRKEQSQLQPAPSASQRFEGEQSLTEQTQFPLPTSSVPPPSQKRSQSGPVVLASGATPPTGVNCTADVKLSPTAAGSIEGARTLAGSAVRARNGPDPPRGSQ